MIFSLSCVFICSCRVLFLSLLFSQNKIGTHRVFESVFTSSSPSCPLPPLTLLPLPRPFRPPRLSSQASSPRLLPASPPSGNDYFRWKNPWSCPGTNGTGFGPMLIIYGSRTKKVSTRRLAIYTTSADFTRQRHGFQRIVLNPAAAKGPLGKRLAAV